MQSFSDLGLSQPILEAIETLGFVTPTPIQEKTIPVLLANNRDLIALAQTGTGKTAAFGMPLIQLIDSNASHTQVLILAPTRELCMQITSDIKS
ncbi:MAG: DEAD/DEAH box helicase, partial [Chitinophagales bacterium]|nr:DEAD/DEAH box helicase [Chitinophagales bacterium]